MFRLSVESSYIYAVVIYDTMVLLCRNKNDTTDVTQATPSPNTLRVEHA